MSDADARTFPQLLGDLTSDLTSLLRKESELVRAEFGEKVSLLGKAGGEIAGGAICLLAALMVLLQALSIALSKYMDAAWASLLVGVVIALIGLVLVRAGAKMASPDGLRPDRSIRQVEKDVTLAKDQVK
jgi:xanthine/uracil permease